MIVLYANHLAESGHQVIIKTNVIDTVFAIDERISIHPLRYSGKFGTIFSALFEKTSSDYIIADIIAMVCLLSFRNHHKLICFAQDYDESYYSNNLQKLLIRLLYLLGLTLFKIRTLAVSKPLADILRSRFNADVTVVENGIDTNAFHVDPDKELLSAKEGRKAVLLHSRADYRKGFDVAVKVIEQLQSKLTAPIEVWTVGEPANGLFPSYTQRDFGYVGESELRRIMSSADVFLYPTRHEGFGLMPLEAMACGCAVVTTTTVSFAVHEENSLVAEVDDSELLTKHLITMLTDECLFRRLTEAGKQLVSKYRLSNASRQFEMTLVKMLQK